MTQTEDHIAQAERHVREGNHRIERQKLLIDELERHGHLSPAGEGRKLLATFEQTLKLAREHLRIEHQYRKPTR